MQNIYLIIKVLLYENVGRALVALLSGNEDFYLFCPGDPPGASLHYQHYRTIEPLLNMIILLIHNCSAVRRCREGPCGSPIRK